MTALLLTLLAGGVGYVGLLVYAWYCADRLLFAHPRPSYDDAPPVFHIPARDGTPLAAVALFAPGAKHTILFLHGNAEDLGHIRPRLEALHRHGHSVVAFDYRGYGRTPGRPSEANLTTDTEDVLRHIEERLGVPAEEVILYGRSMGAGPAVNLAVSHPVGGLVIEGGFTSAFRVVTRVRVIPWDRFDNIAKVPRVSCPVLVMHGRRDFTVPFHHGRSLVSALPAGTATLWSEEAGHNDLPEVLGEAYWRALEALATRVGQTRE